MKFVFPTSKIKHYRFPTHTNDLVLDRADAETSEVFVVVLEPGEAPPFHKHDDTEQIFYILKGRGLLRVAAKRTLMSVQPGDVVRIPRKMYHSIRCDGNRPLVYLAIDCFAGGRPKAEPTWDSHARVLCKQNGWKYSQVVNRKNPKRHGN
ncbi:MAG TPA: cupin domain-containing protein [Verrucomicrobiae bacterium]|jgi:oxalate decarboxylase/phosphoglucose isomerase-like protein (cupin superfamily)